MTKRARCHSLAFVKKKQLETILEREKYRAALNSFEKAYGRLVVEGFNNNDANMTSLMQDVFVAYNSIPINGYQDPIKIMLGDNLLKAINALEEKRMPPVEYSKAAQVMKIDGYC